MTANGYVMSPADWEGIETSTMTAGQYVLTEAGAGVPVDRAARRLWGVPVALSVGITPGSGVLLAADSVALNTDRGVRIDWSENIADDFARNQMRPLRGPGRAVGLRPAGVVTMDQAA